MSRSSNLVRVDHAWRPHSTRGHDEPPHPRSTSIELAPVMRGLASCRFPNRRLPNREDQADFFLSSLTSSKSASTTLSPPAPLVFWPSLAAPPGPASPPAPGCP